MNKKQQKLIDEALVILQELDFPRAQQNERSALTLLALLNLTPSKTWKNAEAVMIGIRAILDFCRSHYGKPYAENTRETFRRQTMHQFVAAGLAVENPGEVKKSLTIACTVNECHKTLFQVALVCGEQRGFRQVYILQWHSSVTHTFPSLREGNEAVEP